MYIESATAASAQHSNNNIHIPIYVIYVYDIYQSKTAPNPTKISDIRKFINTIKNIKRVAVLLLKNLSFYTMMANFKE